VRVSQTAGSWVADIKPGGALHWVMGTSTPCTSIFKPVWMDAGLPDVGPEPAGTYDRESLWWRHEILHREVLRDYAARLAVFREERDLLESRFLEEAEFSENLDSRKRLQFSAACFADAARFEMDWIDRIKDRSLDTHMPLFHALAWRRFNREAGL